MKNDTGSQENENNCYDPRDAVDFYSHIGPEAKRFCRADALFDEKTDKKTKKKAIIPKTGSLLPHLLRGWLKYWFSELVLLGICFIKAPCCRYTYLLNLCKNEVNC